MNRLGAVITLAAAGALLSGCSLVNTPANEAPRDPSGSVIEGNDDADVFEIKVGDCLNDATSSGTVTSVPIVPCDEPHDSEAYASIMLDDGDFPGDDAIRAKAESGCVESFGDFVGVEFNASELAYTYYFPSADSWSQGDREILCEVYDPDSQTTGTLEGSKR
jgi:hypothetical protein